MAEIWIVLNVQILEKPRWTGISGESKKRINAEGAKDVGEDYIDSMAAVRGRRQTRLFRSLKHGAEFLGFSLSALCVPLR